LFLSGSSEGEQKSLVLWGTNLSSNIGYPRFNRIVSNMVELPNYEYSIIIGLLLSDGYLRITKDSVNALLCLSQSLNHFKYLWSVFNALAHYCAVLPKCRIKRRNHLQTF